MLVKVGDYVTRKSHGYDILFEVIEIDEDQKIAYLKGKDWRLIADAPLDDLKKVESEEMENWIKKITKIGNDYLQLIKKKRKKMRESNEDKLEKPKENKGYFEAPGRVLHLDGDKNYVNICKELYEKVNVPAYTYHIAENEMAQRVTELLTELQPDILVITGHDAYKKSGKKTDMDAYRNSQNFVEAVKKARAWGKSRDRLTIFAGACQSYFEALLEAGADFASSPERINIHAQDPVYIAERVAYTSIRDVLDVRGMTENTFSGLKGIGGMETRGRLRIGIPLTDEMDRKFKKN